MSHSNPIQLYKSMMYLNSITDAPKHSPAHRNRITRYGVVWRNLDSTWAKRAYEIQTRITRFPDDSEIIIDAVLFITQVFSKNIFGIPVNHYNAASVEGFMDDIGRVIVEKQPRLLSVLGWERIFMDDDPEQHKDLDSKMLTWTISPKFIDMATQDKSGVLDMLCVINTLTKLLQK